MTLADRIVSHPRVGVTGIGYVGLPLAVEMAKTGFPVAGLDLHISFIRQASRTIAPHFGEGKLVLWRALLSTTEGVVLPLEGDRFNVVRDFFLAFFPERISSGKKKHGPSFRPGGWG